MRSALLAQLRASVAALALFTAITGIAYPCLVTAIAQLAFAHEANGSVIVRHGAAVGSTRIGQAFDSPRYFWGRLSATTDAKGNPLPYNGGSSAGSNLGPTNPALLDEMQGRETALHSAGADNQAAPIPVDLVTSSGSGLDPDITVAAALYQVPRVASARAVTQDAVRALVEAHIEERQLGILGEPRVNVLELNLALDN